MSDGTKRPEDGEQTLDGAKAPGWENVASPQPPAGYVMPPLPPQQPYGGQGYVPQGWVPPQGQYVPPPPPPPQGAQPGHGYQPVYDGRGQQQYPPPPPPGYPPQPPYGDNGQPYGGQYPPPYPPQYPPQNQYGGANAAEFLAAATFLPWWRRRSWGGGYGYRRRRHAIWPLLAFLLFFFLFSRGCHMLLHGW